MAALAVLLTMVGESQATAPTARSVVTSVHLLQYLQARSRARRGPARTISFGDTVEISVDGEGRLRMMVVLLDSGRYDFDFTHQTVSSNGLVIPIEEAPLLEIYQHLNHVADSHRQHDDIEILEEIIDKFHLKGSVHSPQPGRPAERTHGTA